MLTLVLGGTISFLCHSHPRSRIGKSGKCWWVIHGNKIYIKGSRRSVVVILWVSFLKRGRAFECALWKCGFFTGRTVCMEWPVVVIIIAFICHKLCACRHSECLTNTELFNSHNKPILQIVLLHPHSTDEETEACKIKYLVQGYTALNIRARIQHQKLCSLKSVLTTPIYHLSKMKITF